MSINQLKAILTENLPNTAERIIGQKYEGLYSRKAYQWGFVLVGDYTLTVDMTDDTIVNIDFGDLS